VYIFLRALDSSIMEPLNGNHIRQQQQLAQQQQPATWDLEGPGRSGARARTALLSGPFSNWRVAAEKGLKNVIPS
jgi:hypothetical protein